MIRQTVLIIHQCSTEYPCNIGFTPFLTLQSELVEFQSSKDTQPYHPPLSQSGLPVVGSLDYPDAPPTTPLLPELERSRHSFARKWQHRSNVCLISAWQELEMVQFSF
uniref:Uncharacterized protein n=1 Tax=Anabas testudineus TaxID=64144 RepID=A0A3Q1IJ09_ANATE